MNEDVALVVETLVEMGVISEEGCKKLANIFRTLKELSTSAQSYKQGQGGFYVKQDIRHPEPVGEATSRQDADAQSPEQHEKPLHLGDDAVHSAAPPAQDRLQRILEASQSPLTHEPTSAPDSCEDESEESNERLDAATEPELEQRTTKTRRRRAPNGSFALSKEELSKLRETLTIKQIAEQYQVSSATVYNRLREMGLTDPRRRGRFAGRKQGSTQPLSDAP